TRSYLPSLPLLSAIWGSSYMFIKVGVRDFSPAAMVELRLLLAGAVLVSFAAARRGLRAVRPALAPGAFVGVVGMALPFLLISWGETHVDSGVAAVANSSVPIFVAFLALWFAATERSTGLRVVGLAVGLAGVGSVMPSRASTSSGASSWEGWSSPRRRCSPVRWRCFRWRSCGCPIRSGGSPWPVSRCSASSEPGLPS
ncbi:MAG: DMT family transporter, partial [Actinobacteria bacterium]